MTIYSELVKADSSTSNRIIVSLIDTVTLSGVWNGFNENEISLPRSTVHKLKQLRIHATYSNFAMCTIYTSLLLNSVVHSDSRGTYVCILNLEFASCVVPNFAKISLMNATKFGSILVEQPGHFYNRSASPYYARCGISCTWPAEQTRVRTLEPVHATSPS